MVDQVDQENNPIAEADKLSIDRLFSLDPQFLTEQNILSIIEKLRSGRGTWIKETRGIKSGSAKKGGKKLSSDEAKALLSSLDLKLF